MADARPTCCHCRLPIHPGSTGLRHYGLYTAHSENECTRLLQAEVDSMKADRDAALQLAAGVAKDFERMVASRDAAAAQAQAAARDSARVLAMYRALRERMQAAMQETIEEQAR